MDKSVAVAGLLGSSLLVGVPAGAAPGAPPSGDPVHTAEPEALEREDGWLELDRQIDRLSSPRERADGGIGWSFLFRAAFVSAHDGIATKNLPGSKRQGVDIAGIDFNDLDLAFWGSVRQYGWRLSVDILGDDEVSSAALGGGNANGGITFDSGDEIQLEDAYVYWDYGDTFRVTVGHFKMPLVYSAGIDPENTLFMDRTALGSYLDVWQAGAMFNGDVLLPEACGGGLVRWYAALQDGRQASRQNLTDPLGRSFQDAETGARYAFRIEWDLGTGAGAWEGARDSNDRFNATLGVSYAYHSRLRGRGSSDSLMAVDFYGDYRALGFGLEWANLGGTVGGPVSGDYGHLNVNSPLNMNVQSGTPAGAMVSYLITPEWELGIRYEALGNDTVTQVRGGNLVGADNTVVSYVLNYYRAGNNAKWQLAYTSINSRQFPQNAPTTSFDEGRYLQFGLTVGASR